MTEQEREALSPTARLQADGWTQQQAEALVSHVQGMEGSDSEVADALNAPDPEQEPARDATDMVAARGVLISLMAWPAVLRACNSNDQDVSDAAILLRDSCSPPLTLILTNVPEILIRIQQVLGFLVTKGVLTQDVVEALLSLSERPQSWAEVVLGRAVSVRDIGLARGGK